MRLTHVEVSVARGGLQDDAVEDLDRLLQGAFGWVGVTAVGEHPSLGPTIARTYTVDGTGTRLVLREADEAMQGGTEDHLGIAVTAEEIEQLGRACHAVDGLETRYLEDGVPSSIATSSGVFRTFFVRHPRITLWFQFEA